METRKQYKTVEIIASESEWTPPPARYADNEVVALRIGFNEKPLQEQAKAAGAKWDRDQKLWFVRYRSVAGTKLEKLIALEAKENT